MAPHPHKNLLIANWNANGVSTRPLELQQFLVNHQVDVACLTETRLSPGKSLFVQGYSVFHQPRLGPDGSLSPGGGVAVLVKKGITATTISAGGLPVESLGVKITMRGSPPLIVVSAYSPPKASDLSSLTSLLHRSEPTVVAGDLNAKHTAWGCHSTNPKGKALLRLACRHGLTIEAPSEATHYPGDLRKRPDILDVFVTRGVHASGDARVLCELSSDHRPVLLELSLSPALTPATSPRVDWLKLRYLLERSPLRLGPISTPPELEAAVEELTTDINTATAGATTAVPVSPPSAALPPELRRLIKSRNRLRRQLQRSGDRGLRPQINALQREIKACIVRLTSEKFEGFVAEAERHPRSVWKVTRALRGRRPVLPPLKVGDSVFSLDSEKSEVFAESLHRQCSPHPSLEEFSDFHEEVSECVRSFSPTNPDFPPASPAEVSRLIRALNARKAPGRDGVRNSVLKLLPRKHTVAICSIVNAIMRLCHFPSCWKEATVIFLPKQGKPLSSPSSYRPISLLPSLSKLAEAVLLSRLEAHVTARGIIPNFQHGFRKRHGAAHQLLRVAEYIADGLNRRHHTAMALLDHKQAFDRVWHDGLLYKMIALGFPHYLIAVTKSYLSGRSIRARVGDSLSDPYPISAGVPQGSKLGPSFYNIFGHDLPVDGKILVAQYADDTALLRTTPQIHACAAQLNRYLPQLLRWYDRWRVAINHTKSEAVFFSKRRRLKPQNIIVGPHRVPWGPSAKYLGVVLDRGLSWGPHITSVCGKATGAFLALRPFFSNKRVSPKTKLRAFSAIIRSICTYAIPIWGCAEPHRLRRVQGKFMALLRSALRIPWYVRNTQILRETRILSPSQAAPTFAANLRNSIVAHPNPTISSLAGCVPKSYDWVKRPCSLLRH